MMAKPTREHDWGLSSAERAAIARKPILMTIDVAKLIGWKVDAARRWLKKEKAARRAGREYTTTIQRLRECFPEACDAVQAAAAERDDW